jgi:hypothetical protein
MKKDRNDMLESQCDQDVEQDPMQFVEGVDNIINVHIRFMFRTSNEFDSG